MNVEQANKIASTPRPILGKDTSTPFLKTTLHNPGHTPGEKLKTRLKPKSKK